MEVASAWSAYCYLDSTPPLSRHTEPPNLMVASVRRASDWPPELELELERELAQEMPVVLEREPVLDARTGYTLLRLWHSRVCTVRRRRLPGPPLTEPLHRPLHPVGAPQDPAQEEAG